MMEGVLILTPKEQKAHDYFYGGYNCAQAVFAAFHEEMGLSEELALKLMMPMGGGVGGLRDICGALCGAAMALGMLRKDVKPNDVDAKKAMYALVQEKAARFREQFTTWNCGALLAINDLQPAPVPAVRDAHYYEVRPCGKYVEACARLVEEELGKA
jgi:C_GCAxxG_C_C family probable redox protein